jgi:hypothetical protein
LLLHLVVVWPLVVMEKVVMETEEEEEVDNHYV